LYLLVVLATGGVLIVAAIALRDWKAVGYMSVTALGVAAWYIVTAVLMDRPVFRVSLPLAYVFFAISVIAFPWSTFAPGRLSTTVRRRLVIWSKCAVILVTALSAILGIAQVRANALQQRLFADLTKQLRHVVTADDTLVSWADAFPFQYSSPFELTPLFDRNLYPVIGTYSSYPDRLERFKERFGNDIYQGLVAPGTVHLVASNDQLEQLRLFSIEHYRRDITFVKLAEFKVAYREEGLWRAENRDNQ
jgi:hypothetical protein